MARFFKPLLLHSLHIRVGISVRSIVKLLCSKPRYMFVALGVSMLFYEFIFWFLNLGLLQYLLMSPYLSLAGKLHMILGSYAEVFTWPVSLLSLTLFIVSLLQGVAAAALTYVIRIERGTNRDVLQGLSGTGIAGVLSVFGLGCAACGTSLVTPVLTFLFATSSVTVAEQVGIYAALLSLVASAVTVHLLGLRVSSKLLAHTSPSSK